MDNEMFTTEGQKNLDAFKALLEIDEKERSFKTRQGYQSAYLMSVLLPPIGIYYCVKYLLFSDGSSDSRRAGIVSLILTLVSMAFGFILFKMLFGSMNIVSAPDNTDKLKEMLAPESQKAIRDLLR